MKFEVEESFQSGWDMVLASSRVRHTLDGEAGRRSIRCIEGLDLASVKRTPVDRRIY
jgi:hypothetical protein